MLQLKKKYFQLNSIAKIMGNVYFDKRTIFEFYSLMLVVRLSLQRYCEVEILVEMLLLKAVPIVAIRVPNVALVAQLLSEYPAKQSLQWKTFE